jgi:hypothetical protein
LTPNVSCAIQNTPQGAQPFCLALGDWAGGNGQGPMFVMGLSAVQDGQAVVTSVADEADFADIGYVGLGLATYLNADDLAEEEKWRMTASVKRLDRSGLAFDASGGSLAFDDFLDVTPLVQNDRVFSINSVDTTVTAHYSEHRFELVHSVSYQAGDECDEVTEDIWRSTYWQVLTPGDVLEFNLPELPEDWPRQAEGGLAIPAENQRLSWSFSAYHLGLLDGFDFDSFDFENAQRSVTHSSSNSQDL